MNVASHGGRIRTHTIPTMAALTTVRRMRTLALAHITIAHDTPSAQPLMNSSSSCIPGSTPRQRR